MRQICFLMGVFCASVSAQESATDLFHKAPPHVDEALRARVTKFFQSHVDGKFSRAFELVAEDSKEIFFAAEKQQYRSFEIVKIDYSEDFTNAKVITAVEVEWRTPRTGVMIVKPPMTTLWKLENGDWFWYVVPKKEWETPWGTMNPGPDGKPLSIIDAFKGVNPDEVIRGVRASKPAVQLSSYQEATDTTEIINKLPGEVSLRLDAVAMPGLEVKMDREVLKSGEKAVLTFHYAPEVPNPKATVVARVHVSPLGQVIPIEVRFSVPPEALQRVPNQ